MYRLFASVTDSVQTQTHTRPHLHTHMHTHTSLRIRFYTAHTSLYTQVICMDAESGEDVEVPYVRLRIK